MHSVRMAAESNSVTQGPTASVLRILIVENEGAIARSVERLIRRIATTALEVVHVDTAEAAMSLLKTCDPFDAVISDCRLAGTATGLDVLAASRALPVPPRFLFLTSDERAQGLGVLCLEKPCAPSELRAAIAKLLEVEDEPKTVREMPLDYSHAFDVGGEA